MIGKHELIDELTKRGAHQTDIGDALYAADPDWNSNMTHYLAARWFVSAFRRM